MSRFIRASKFRHVYGTPTKREHCYENIKASMNAWDTNIINSFLAINWNAGGGGAFAVIPLGTTDVGVGKLPQDQPLFSGHTAAVLDTAFSPFNDTVIASCSEDAKVMVWVIPEFGLEEHMTEAAVTLIGHNRKVGHVSFHPTAENVLVSCGADLRVKLWDVQHGQEKQDFRGHGEVVQSISWNTNGSLLATTCRDKKMRVIDIRANQVVQEAQGHQGIKGSRSVWLGDGHIATTGFSRSSDRQILLWDSANLAKPVKTIPVDSSAGVLMPFYDGDTKMLYLAGKGDGNIRYYEYEGQDLHYLSEYKSSDPQRGMAFMPKRALNINECEVMRAYKVLNNIIEPISFTVPRKADTFQDDIYPHTFSGEPSMTAQEYFEGKDADPVLVDLSQGFMPNAFKEFHAIPRLSIAEPLSMGDLPSPTVGHRGSVFQAGRSPGLLPMRSPSFGAKDYDKDIDALKEENDLLKKRSEEHEQRIQELEATVAKLMNKLSPPEEDKVEVEETKEE